MFQFGSRKNRRRSSSISTKNRLRKRRVLMFQTLQERITPAVNAFFSPTAGILSVLGDSLDNNITVSRNAAGQILVNGGAVAVSGGTPTVANTARIQVFGQSGNDTITLNEANGALPAALLFGGAGTMCLPADQEGTKSSARPATTRCSAREESICCSAVTAMTS